MLDVARHFFGVDDVKRYIDLIALYKINRLHLHLADDQGWRIEIKSWPNLATRRRQHRGRRRRRRLLHASAVLRELVAYAARRFITIVPEIDMPGHTNAALASYAELNCDGVAPQLYTGIEVGFSALCVDKDITYTFIDDVVREIAALTPGAVLPHRRRRGEDAHAASSTSRFIERVQKHRPVARQADDRLGRDRAGAARCRRPIVQHWRPDGVAGAGGRRRARGS